MAVAVARELSGPARLGRRTKLIVKTLAAGEIAVLDHRDLDRVSAEDLIGAGVLAVLNCSPSSTGAYPNMGPLLLVQAGIHLVDLPDDTLFKRLKDGDTITIRGGEILRGTKVIATGVVQEPAAVRAATDERRREIGDALEAFARNTIEHMLEERELLSGRIELPRFDTDFRDHPALIVVRGVDHEKDLRMLRPYIRDVKPKIIAVDGGANALLAEGFKPDMIVGDMDSASDAALRCGAELVVHAYPDGRAPGREHLESLELPFKLVPAPGHEPGRRDDHRRREGRRADRLRRIAVQPRRVPRQEPPRDGVDVPHAPAPGRDPRRRQGREPAVPAAAGALAASSSSRRRAWCACWLSSC